MKVILPMFLILVSTTMLAAQTRPKLPKRYMLSVDVRSNKESFTSYTVSLVAGKKTTKLSRSAAKHYGSVFFNRPKDVIWVGCVGKYLLKRSSSRTGSQLMWQDETDKEHWATGVLFEDNFAGEIFNLTITCSK